MRVQVNISDEMVNRLDVIAKQMGVSRSALCSMLIGQGVMTYESSMQIVLEKLGNDQFIHDLLKDVKN